MRNGVLLLVALLIAPASAVACMGGPLFVRTKLGCSIQIPRESSAAEAGLELKKFEETCKLSEEDLESIGTLLTQKLDVFEMSEAEFEDLRGKTERKENCLVMRQSARAGRWTGLSMSTGKWDAEAEQCLMPKC